MKAPATSATAARDRSAAMDERRGAGDGERHPDQVVGRCRRRTASASRARDTTTPRVCPRRGRAGTRSRPGTATCSASSRNRNGVEVTRAEHVEHAERPAGGYSTSKSRYGVPGASRDRAGSAPRPTAVAKRARRQVCALAARSRAGTTSWNTTIGGHARERAAAVPGGRRRDSGGRRPVGIDIAAQACYRRGTPARYPAQKISSARPTTPRCGDRAVTRRPTRSPYPVYGEATTCCVSRLRCRTTTPSRPPTSSSRGSPRPSRRSATGC